MRRFLTPVLFVLASALLLGGCVSDTWIYTWHRAADHPRWVGVADQPNATLLQADWNECIQEIRGTYIPRAAGDGPWRGLLKTCMEKRGYAKVGDAVNVPIGEKQTYWKDSQTVVKIR